MKLFAVLLLAAFAALTSFAEGDSVVYDFVQIGTNFYQQVTLKPYSAREVILKYDRGSMKIRVDKLPESLSSDKLVKELRDREAARRQKEINDAKPPPAPTTLVAATISNQGELGQSSTRIPGQTINVPLQAKEQPTATTEVPTEISDALKVLATVVGVILLLGFVISFYFLPTIEARRKRKKNADAIFYLNVFLGWTFLGWVVALVWAECND